MQQTPQPAPSRWGWGSLTPHPPLPRLGINSAQEGAPKRNRRETLEEKALWGPRHKAGCLQPSASLGHSVQRCRPGGAGGRARTIPKSAQFPSLTWCRVTLGERECEHMRTSCAPSIHTTAPQGLCSVPQKLPRRLGAAGDPGAELGRELHGEGVTSCMSTTAYPEGEGNAFLCEVLWMCLPGARPPVEPSTPPHPRLCTQAQAPNRVRRLASDPHGCNTHPHSRHPPPPPRAGGAKRLQDPEHPEGQRLTSKGSRRRRADRTPIYTRPPSDSSSRCPRS